MRGKKVLFLFLALMLPVFVFLFLKIFGKNQFDVPLLYQEGKIEAPSYCGIDYTVPYRLPDTVMTALQADKNATLIILDFSDAETDLNRVREQFDEMKVTIKKTSSLSYSQSELNFLKDCVVLLQAPNTVVLIDSLKQIRGYYEGSEREDIDRLLVELNIILKKY